MYKLTDSHEKTVHEISEENLINYLKNDLDMEDADRLSIEEIEHILFMQGYYLERQ